jgi:hypothetical protein
MTSWNYIGIDPDPPPGPLLILTSEGETVSGHRKHPAMIAWQEKPTRNKFKERCQDILHGLPEIRMLGSILGNDELMLELSVAVHSYDDTKLADFVDLVRTLHTQWLALSTPNHHSQ